MSANELEARYAAAVRTIQVEENGDRALHLAATKPMDTCLSAPFSLMLQKGQPLYGHVSKTTWNQILTVPNPNISLASQWHFTIIPWMSHFALK